MPHSKKFLLFEYRFFHLTVKNRDFRQHDAYMKLHKLQSSFNVNIFPTKISPYFSKLNHRISNSNKFFSNSNYRLCFFKQNYLKIWINQWNFFICSWLYLNKKNRWILMQRKKNKLILAEWQISPCDSLISLKHTKVAAGCVPRSSMSVDLEKKYLSPGQNQSKNKHKSKSVRG